MNKKAGSSIILFLAPPPPKKKENLQTAIAITPSSVRVKNVTAKKLLVLY